MGAGALGDGAGEVDVALGALGVLRENGFSLLEEDVDPFQGDHCGLFWHCRPAF